MYVLKIYIYTHGRVVASNLFQHVAKKKTRIINPSHGFRYVVWVCDVDWIFCYLKIIDIGDFG